MYTAIAEREAPEELREEMRLLYVAMTRARDYLYVSGGAKGAKAGTWYQRVQAAIPLLKSKYADTAWIKFDDKLDRMKDEDLPTPHADAIEPLPDIDQVREAIERATPPVFDPPLRIPVTALGVLARCPRCFARPLNEPDEGTSHDLSDDDAARRLDLGTRVHAVLASIDFANPCWDTMDAEIANHVKRLRASLIWNELAANASGLHRETPIVLRVDGAILVGAVDCVWRDATGLHLLDYKTGRHSSQGAIEHETQLVVYALALQKWYGVWPTSIRNVYTGGETVRIATIAKSADDAATFVADLIAQAKTGVATPSPTCPKCNPA